MAGGVIEIDETSFRESFKGYHKKSTTFTMPRKPIKEGLKVAEVIKMKKGKEVYQSNKFVFYVLWIEQVILLLNLFAREE